MDDFFSRSSALLGEKGLEALRTKRVIIFGVGGVGSWAAEALVRTGLTHLTIVDDDVVQASNVNRQLPATRATIGQPKVEVLRQRLLEINPDAEIVALQQRYTPETSFNFQLSTFNYVIDAIDSVNDKTDLIINATRARTCKIFSSMGAALRFDPTQVTTGELMSIKGDALAKAVRARMKKLDIHPYKKVKCVYSTEPAVKVVSNQPSAVSKGSLMQVTAVFGCTLAAMVVKSICNL